MVTSVDGHSLRNAVLGFACLRRFKKAPKIASTNYTNTRPDLIDLAVPKRIASDTELSRQTTPEQLEGFLNIAAFFEDRSRVPG